MLEDALVGVRGSLVVGLLSVVSVAFLARWRILEDLVVRIDFVVEPRVYATGLCFRHDDRVGEALSELLGIGRI